MSVKKPSIEEKLSQSIFYNLSILRMAIKTTVDFDENFSSTMFMKSNTKAFIHVTHFLFNIIDAKEFKAKFYWPITEKKFENSYRSSSVEFINHLIDKHGLAQEKIKIPFVVHPCGKKFLSVILDLVKIALKEVLRRRKLTTDSSIDLEKTEEVCTNMKLVENEMIANINNETKAIRARTDAIKGLLNQIYSPGEQGVPLEEFVRSWHEFNRSRLQSIRDDRQSMEVIFEDIEKLKEKARDMLAPKTFEPFAPATEECRDLVDYYEDNGSVQELDLKWFVAKLHEVLPTINKFVADFSVDPENVTVEELRVVKKLSQELKKIEAKTEKLHVTLKTKVAQTVRDLEKSHREQKRLEEENQSPEKLSEVKARDDMELEKLKVLQSPPIYFDTTKNCLKNVALSKTRLALLHDDGTKEKDNLNESKMFRSMRQMSGKNFKPNESKLCSEMAPPARPNSRRRMDAMELLERATSNRYDLNNTRRTGAIPKQNLKAPVPTFSSTMLSPQLRPDILDCSSISAISKASPVVDTSLDSTLGESVRFNSTVNYEKSQMPNRDPPTVIVNNATLGGYENFDSTVKQNGSANFTGNSKTVDSLDAMRMRLVSDEDLFNISDTVLQEADE